MAKKFKFKLDSFLKIKKFNVQKAEDELNKILSLKYAREQTILSLKNEIIEINNFKGKSTIVDLQSNFHRKTFIDELIVKEKYEITKLEEIEKIKRQDLSNALKEEKIIDKIKDKKMVEHKFELNKEEEFQLDEIGIAGFVKNRTK